MIPEVTDFLISVIQDRGNHPDQGSLQTKLFEIHVLYSPPQVVDRLISAGSYSYYDKSYIENLQLFQ
jgi:hypothetical protein